MVPPVTAPGRPDPEPPPSLPEAPARRYDQDWLTVLATLVIFLFHCARYFDADFWHVKNPQPDRTATLFVHITSQWIMPLFFLLSGAASHYSLKSRSAGRYLGNRFRRLMIPLIFGTLVVLVPVQVWIERVTQGGFKGSLLEFYPHYFEGFYAFGGNFAWMGLHLWYLEMLFVFTLLTLPLLLWLERAGPRRTVSGAAAWMEKPGAILLPGLALWGMEFLVNLQPEGVGVRAFGGWSLFTYLVVFILGYLRALDPAFREAMIRHRFPALGLGAVTTSLMFFTPVDLRPLGEWVQYTAATFVRGFNCWFWLVAIVGFGGRHLDFSNNFLGRAREAALPFYILHQTVIVVLGYYLIPWGTGPGLKYAVLTGASLLIILGLCQGLIQRLKPLRFLFGMR